ncbi:hypothetical protein [Salirhabdus sp. Marseille-P4669]|uniref:hypothetical protein n=1 Tax=Salirhabdus sp. Marseille-P4669 TaxID=2042310 RepID=UPI000C79F607|nr:hypothetical protein [Salirhabdus sp. Marseille-P4669]
MVNWKKTLGTSVLSAGLLFSSYAPMISTSTDVTISAKTTTATNEVAFPFESEHFSGPFDVALLTLRSY